MDIRIFDTHAHYDDRAFDADRDEVLDSLLSKGVEAVTNIGCDMQTSRNTDALTKRYDFMYGAVGVIPSECGDMTEDDIEELRALIRNNSKIRAVGEIGLDYHWDDAPEREVQKKWFIRQLELAYEEKLPVVIHSRDAAEDTIEILKSFYAEYPVEQPGVMHCYSYSKEIAQILLGMNFYFGIGGVISFKNAKKLVKAVEVIPAENLVVETDCPYLAPEPYRGRRNYSGYLSYVIEKIAEIKGLSTADAAAVTWENAHRLYRL